MSLTSGPINETEQAGEKLTDHIAQTVGAQVATMLPSLTGYELVIRISLEKKPC